MIVVIIKKNLEIIRCLESCPDEGSRDFIKKQGEKEKR